MIEGLSGSELIEGLSGRELIEGLSGRELIEAPDGAAVALSLEQSNATSSNRRS